MDGRGVSDIKTTNEVRTRMRDLWGNTRAWVECSFSAGYACGRAGLPVVFDGERAFVGFTTPDPEEIARELQIVMSMTANLSTG